MEDSVDELMKQLCSSNKLDRDRGVVELEKLLTARDADVQGLQKCIINVLTNPDDSWEGKYGCLLAARALVPYLNIAEPLDSTFLKNLKNISKNLITDLDHRVRLITGEVLGALCQKVGIEVYMDVKEIVMKLIRNNLEKVVEDEDWSSVIERNETERLVAKVLSGPSYNRKSVSDVSQAINESTGWMNLETSLKCLDCLIQGCANCYRNFIDEELLGVLYKILSHSNHNVRLTGFQLCSSLFKVMKAREESELQTSPPSLRLCLHLANGLSDNWPQVRLSASVATRSFLLSVPEQVRHNVYPLLLPRMCLNRYFVADGVRVYSQETWRQVTGATGKELVQQYLGPTAEYYRESAKSENHAVREAACACISELATKMPLGALCLYVPGLLEALLNCFQDENWPVRDAACLACGSFILNFPDMLEGALGELLPLFYRNLADANATVRQGAATTLTNVVRAYGEPMVQPILSFVKEGIKGMEKQESSPSSGSSPSLARRSRDFDVEPAYIKSENREAAATSSQPWQLVVGCVHLVSELSSIQVTHSYLIEVLALFKKATKYKHYEQHVTLLESICKQLPVIARNLGRPIFSHVVEDFYDDLFYALGSENGLTSSAASQCLNTLATFLGRNLLRAKISNYNPGYVTAFESVIHVAPF